MTSRSTSPRRTCSSSPLHRHVFLHPQRPDDFRAARAVIYRHAVREEAVALEPLERLVARVGQPAGPARLVCRKTGRPPRGWRLSSIRSASGYFSSSSPAITPRPSGPENRAITRPRRVRCRCLSSRPSRFQSQISVGFGSSAKHSARCAQVKQNGAGSFARRTSRARPVSVRRPHGQRLRDLLRRLDAERDELAREKPALEIRRRLVDGPAGRELLQQRTPRQRRGPAQPAPCAPGPVAAIVSVTST